MKVEMCVRDARLRLDISSQGGRCPIITVIPKRCHSEGCWIRFRDSTREALYRAWLGTDGCRDVPVVGRNR